MPTLADPQPCTRTQEAFWLAEQMDALGPANSLPFAIELPDGLDEQLAAAALAAVAARQPLLRTRFEVRSGRLLRLLHDEPPALPRAELDPGRTAAEVERRSRHPLDLLAAPWEAVLLCEPRRRTLFADFHHAVFDGLSKDVLAEQFAVACLALAAGRAPELPPAPAVEGFAAGEPARTAALADAARAHWDPALGAIAEATRLVPAHVAEGRGEAIAFPLGAAELRGLRSARTAGGSAFALAVAAVQLVHCAAVGDDDSTVVTAVPFGTRSEDLATAIGPFVNDMPLWSRPGDHRDLPSLLGAIAAQARALSGLRAFPFNDAVARFGPRVDPRRLLADVDLSYRRLGREPAAIRRAGLRVDRLLPIYGDHPHLRFRLLVQESAPAALLEYHGGCFPPAAAERLAAALRALLRAAGERADRPLGALLDRAREEL